MKKIRWLVVLLVAAVGLMLVAGGCGGLSFLRVSKAIFHSFEPGFQESPDVFGPVIHDRRAEDNHIWEEPCFFIRVYYFIPI